MDSGKNYYIKDVARLAKLSIGMIGRILLIREGISKNTQVYLQNIIKETGYTKNIMTSRLKLA